MRDLEIRGAGNLLGPEQSGHIAAVGFELYCQLLKQSVSALKGETVRPRLEVQVRFDFLMPEENPSSVEAAEHGQPKSDNLGACIPLKYLSDPRQRIDIYRKLAQTTDRQALTHLRAELRDRFGPLPPALDLLLQIAELKILAGERGVTAMETRVGAVTVSTAVLLVMPPEVAVILELPTPRPVATPLALIEATAPSLEFHVAEPVRSCVLLSV